MVFSKCDLKAKEFFKMSQPNIGETSHAILRVFSGYTMKREIGRNQIFQTCQKLIRPEGSMIVLVIFLSSLSIAY